MKIHLLDMGTKMYGDSILVTHAGKSILIDGGHPHDEESIQEQLATLLDASPPFEIDLLVVTHCHSDHIGCLPALVENEVLKAKYALVADEGLGWGQPAGTDDAFAAKGLSDAQRALVFAALEEDHSSLADGELIDFLADMARLRPGYIAMLEQLEKQGTKVVRFPGVDTAEHEPIEKAFKVFGLKVLGPVQDQLLKCADRLEGRADAIANEIAANKIIADAASHADFYRRLISERVGVDAALEDKPGPGAALNDQSIVLKVSAGGWTALLPGDMQFAKPEVAGINDLMTELRGTVSENGPYDFIKLTHHTSYNGLDDSVLGEWATTRLFAHSGGSNDAGHPDRTALRLLKKHSDELTFARTDRNGIITISKNGDVAMTGAEGDLNDFSPNRGRDVGEPEPKEPREVARPVLQEAVVVREASGEQIEVTAKVPHTATTVTITIRVDPGEKKKMNNTGRPAPANAGEIKLGGGRTLPKLLFVTRRDALKENIGKDEAARV